VISDVSKTLLKLLKDNMQDLLDSNNIVLSSPAEMECVTAPRLSLFLYQVSESLYLKNQEVLGSNRSQLLPLTLQLFYLLTPYAKTEENEQQILGKSMQVFHDNATLGGSVLQGTLKGSEQVLRLTPQYLTFDELVRIWNAFPEKPYKLSVCYQVSPVETDSTREVINRKVMK